ncbi:tetratricopeptide repeat protein [Rhodovulum euryhalinum]|uniref:Tetratricopeptide repeat protein n=1 Tax=Rhodovulum euryhalinum TaxID=35805 RepID=A0A4R2KAW9_9RHOB|nr:tetratricopeptide repeat protein [Rhodovulum euryhalinum]TCO69177.1 tetratricopeptide repeat protein [Rhodovulum euryhalinum]
MRSTTPCRIRASDTIRRGLPLAALVVLTACQTGPGLGPGFQGLPPPRGTPEITEAVDGLIVGHRLMAAGEYELALRAYYRAGAEQGLTVDVLSAIGSANLRLGRLGQAETQLRRALKEDDRFVPAWNNLGVVLMETGETGEARRVFETAFALDSGHSDDIRQNLLLAIEKTGDPAYDAPNKNEFELVRRGSDRYLLLATP